MADALTIGYYITQTATILLNSVGLHLLMKNCRYLRNHDLTIANLSIAEILTSLVYFTTTIMEIHFTDFRIIYDRALNVVFYSVNLAWIFAMFLITLDRFFAINFPFRYKVKATGYRMRLVVIGLWTSSVVICIVLYFVETTKKYFMEQKFVWFTIDVIFVLTFVITYGTIYAKFQKSARRFASSSASNHVSNDTANAASNPTSNSASNPASNPASRRNPNLNRKFLLIVGLIFMTYVLLVIIPEIIFSIIGLQDIGLLLFQINYIIDPLIYVFVREDLRKKLNMSFCCLKKAGRHAIGNNVYAIAGTSICENRSERERRMDVMNTKI